MTQTTTNPPRRGVRLHRERPGEYSLHGTFRISYTADGDWEITAIYDGWRESYVRKVEQAIAFHGTRWPTLAAVREVLPDIMATQHGISTGRLDLP